MAKFMLSFWHLLHNVLDFVTHKPRPFFLWRNDEEFEGGCCVIHEISFISTADAKKDTNEYYLLRLKESVYTIFHFFLFSFQCNMLPQLMHLLIP